MAISGDLRVSASLGPYNSTPRRNYLPIGPISKVDFSSFVNAGACASSCTLMQSRVVINRRGVHCNSKRSVSATDEYELSSSSPVSLEAESFFLNAINMSFLERLNLAWKIMFPSPTAIRKSNANIAKQRLKMILFSDRCAVSEEAKQKIVSNIVTSLSDFVEIESQDKVQLSVSTDPALGTIYSVTVPVRRVKSEYQIDNELGMITNVDYKDNGRSSGSVDVTFDFYLPNENLSDYST